MTSHLRQAYAQDIQFRIANEGMNPEGPVLQATDITEGVVSDQGGVRITAFEVDHAPVRPAFGYRIDYAGRSVVLSGDNRVLGESHSTRYRYRCSYSRSLRPRGPPAHGRAPRPSAQHCGLPYYSRAGRNRIRSSQAALGRVLSHMSPNRDRATGAATDPPHRPRSP